MALDTTMLWLVEVFQNYRKKNHLPNLCPSDLLNTSYKNQLTQQQIDWLQQFIVAWETIEYNVNTNSGDT